MTRTISLSIEESRQTEAAGIDPANFLKNIAASLPQIKNQRRTKNTNLDTENLAAIALLTSWLNQEATIDPVIIAKAEDDLNEFKRNMNANRAATGERLLFL